VLDEHAVNMFAWASRMSGGGSIPQGLKKGGDHQALDLFPEAKRSVGLRAGSVLTLTGQRAGTSSVPLKPLPGPVFSRLGNNSYTFTGDARTQKAHGEDGPARAYL